MAFRSTVYWFYSQIHRTMRQTSGQIVCRTIACALTYIFVLCGNWCKYLHIYIYLYIFVASSIWIGGRLRLFHFDFRKAKCVCNHTLFYASLSITCGRCENCLLQTGRFSMSTRIIDSYIYISTIVLFVRITHIHKHDRIQIIMMIRIAYFLRKCIMQCNGCAAIRERSKHNANIQMRERLRTSIHPSRVR